MPPSRSMPDIFTPPKGVRRSRKYQVRMAISLDRRCPSTTDWHGYDQRTNELSEDWSMVVNQSGKSVSFTSNRTTIGLAIVRYFDCTRIAVPLCSSLPMPIR